MEKKVFILITLLITILTSFASEDPNGSVGIKLENIALPSPDAASLGIFGNVSSGLYTGASQVSIPLYEINSSNVKVPIGLNYSTNGVRVDQIASWVGLGWNLSAGGVITRVVKDEPDMESPVYYPLEMSTTSEATGRWVEQAYDFMFDNQPDIFYYNFPGHSGKFVLDEYMNPYTIPYENIIISHFLDEYNYKTFKVVTPDGVIFLFGGENAIETSEMEQYSAPGTNGMCGKSFSEPHESAWYLTKIIHPKGDTVSFEYGSYHFDNIIGISQTITNLVSYPNCGNSNCPDLGMGVCISEQTGYGKYLQKIKFKNGSVQFYASNNRNDIHSQNGVRLDSIGIFDINEDLIKRFKLDYEESYSGSSFANNYVHQNNSYLKYRLFLREIKELGSENSSKGSYYFEYNDIISLPPRLSFAQDHWGYFNGESNTDFVPYHEGLDVNCNREPNSNFAKKGVLTKVTYPTGGVDSIEYESNYAWENVIIPAPTEVYSLDCHGQGVSLTDGVVTEHGTINIPETNGLVKITFKIDVDLCGFCGELECDELDVCYGESTNEHMEGEVVITKDGEEVYHSTLSPPDNGFSGQYWTGIDDFETYENGNYEIELKATTAYVTSSINITYPTENDTLERQNVITGGVRLKRVTSKSSKGEDIIKRYYYNSYEKRNESSGIRMGAKILLYYSDLIKEISCENSSSRVKTCLYDMFSSSSLNTLVNNGLSTCYETVTVSEGENFEGGGTEHRFHIVDDSQAVPVIGDKYVLYTDQTNTGWYNGEKYSELKFKIIDTSMIPIIKKEFTYTDKVESIKTLKGYGIKKEYEPVYSVQNTMICTEDLIDDCTYYFICTSDAPDHKHEYGLNGSGEYLCMAPGCNNEEVEIVGSYCTGKEEGDTVFFWGDLVVYNVCEYMIYSMWRPLDKVKTLRYDENGLNPMEEAVNYYYDSATTLLKSKVFINSKGDTITTKYKYPSDYYITSVETLQCDANKQTCYSNCLDAYWNCWGACAHDDVLCKEACMQTKLDCNSTCDDTYDTCLDNLIPNQPVKAIKLMQGQYIINSPIEILTTNKSASLEMVSAGIINKYEEYDNIIAKSSTYQLTEKDELLSNYNESLINASNEFIYEEEKYQEVVDYEKYDSQGNLLQFQKTNDVVYSYLWGYNNSYPIAEAQNATYDEIVSALGQSEIDSLKGNTLTDAEIRNKLSALRGSLPNAFVTTYTYDPLIGVTSKTDSNGVSEYYEYDDLGRLILIKNNQGEVIKRVQYNYSDKN